MAEGGGREKMDDAKKRQKLSKLTNITSQQDNPDNTPKKKSKPHYESKLGKLKKVVIRILEKHPDGVLKNDIWTAVKKETGLEVSAKNYGLPKMSRAFEKWLDVIKITGPAQKEILIMKSKIHVENEQTEVDTDDLQLVEGEKIVVKPETKGGRFDDTHLFGTTLEETEKAQDNKGPSSLSPFFDQSTYEPGPVDKKASQTQDVIKQKGTRQVDTNTLTNANVHEKGINMCPDFESFEDSCIESTNGDTDAEEEDIKSVIDDLLEKKEPTNTPPGFSGAAPLPFHASVPPFQLNIPPKLQRQTGIQAPGIQNASTSGQQMGRFSVPAQGFNQMGMMFPYSNPAGMPLMGLPLTYRLQMPTFGQFGISPVPQQVGQHVRLINQTTAHPRGPNTVRKISKDTNTDQLQPLPAKRDHNTATVPLSDSILSSKSTSSTSLEESVNPNVDSALTPEQVLRPSPGSSQLSQAGADKRENPSTTETKASNPEILKEVPVLPSLTEPERMQAQTIMKPIPQWTSLKHCVPTTVTAQSPTESFSINNREYGGVVNPTLQSLNVMREQAPRVAPMPMFPHHSARFDTHKPKTPVSPWTQIGMQEKQQPFLSPISSGMSTRKPNEQERAIPSWAQIAQPTPALNTSPGKATINVGQAVAPSVLAQQIKMTFPVAERPTPSPPSIDWRQYDTPTPQLSLGLQGRTFRNELSYTDVQHVNQSFDRSGLDKWQPFSEDIKCLTVKPICKDEFETKVVDIRPVYVAAGKAPSVEQVDSVAKECIEMLADANEFVTQERVEKIIIQRFLCNRIQDLGIRHVDQLPCVNELNRLISKINAYVTAFLKTRSICTLFELQETLKDFVPAKGEFTELKTGPLQRFPVVFQQFRFPPDMSEIPEITTMDILDHFNNYLSVNRLWINCKLELEPFMNYLVQEYNAENAYMLGVRIRSLPLALTVLKKAKRDSAASHRTIKEHFEENLKTEIGDAFRKFRISILHAGDTDGMEVRRHYLKMKPESTIMEIFEKFEILHLVTQDRRLPRTPKLRRVVEEFLTVMKEDELGRSILHLAICMSNTAVEESVKELLAPDNMANEDENEKQTSRKPPPRKDALVESLKTYLERCLNAGAISLTHLNRIEERMLEDFGFSAFNMMGYGRFMEFLIKETKQILEESGGLLLGSAPGGTESDSSFKPHQTDLVEFIKQYRQHENIQPEQVEEALCTHFNVKEVRQLGYGNITRLLTYADKHGKHMMDSFTVFYEAALLQSCRFSQSSNIKVGILGHQTKEDAKVCLHNCPLLENMADWSQWYLVFEPQLGKLKDFVQKYGGITTKSLEGGKVVTLDFLALEVKPGVLVKILSSTSQEKLAAAIKNHDALATAGHMVSMSVAYRSVENIPLALISRLVTTSLIQMHAEEPTGVKTDISCKLVKHSAATFVLQCLLRSPTKICVALANQVFLEPLGQVVGSSKSKQLLVQLCRSEAELSHLVELGCLLGIQEWTDVIHHKCKIKEASVQALPAEIQDLFDNDDTKQMEEEMVLSEESDSEDVDEILAGDEQDKITEDISTDLVETVDDEDSETTETIADVEKAEKDTNDTLEKNKNSHEEIIDQIRRDEFGVGVKLSEDGQRLMKVQQERLGRSLDRLSKDLYSKDTHFVLELVQNADDNNYADELLTETCDNRPSVKFVIKEDGIYVYNNELGFREKDIRALCDVGRSTKGKHKFGYIGQKGIGFKSVFRITNAPEVHSNGFHIKFDVSSGPMGYIMPHWIPEQEWIYQDKWMTQIILKLKPDMRLQTRTLAARFNDIHPSLLLFLHRLRDITIENKVENATQTMRRRDLGANVVEIQHTHGCDRWLIIKRMLDASQISLQTKSGVDVESTELAIAFPLKHQGKKTVVQRMPPKQPVFAFLPLRSYGFRFIVQGDFDVPSSREDVDRDSPWNQWLRNEIHTVFIDALDTFKAHQDFNSIEAVCAFLQFVPMEDEILEFFKPVASDILKKLKAKQCIPTQPDSQGVISWKMPSQTMKVRDPLVRSVITPDVLETHLSLFYLHDEIACMLNSSLTSCLGIETLTADHLFQLGKALIVNLGTHCSTDEDVVLIAKWMACLYRSLDEFHHDDSVLETLKTHRMLPLSDGELVSLQDKTVFYPIARQSKSGHQGKDPFYHLQQDVKSLHPMLLNTGDNEVNSQVHKLFMRLGIKQLSPFDVVNHHIIPVLKSDDWKSKTPETLISYLVYIKEQIEKQGSVCNLDEIKDIAIVITNQGLKNPSREPVHFPLAYGNQINLQDAFSGYSWTLLDTSYLPRPCTPAVAITWKEFFKKLGVEEFLSIRRKDVHITRDELDGSLWSSLCAMWPKEEEEYTIEDYYSAELEGLLTNNRDRHRFTEQMSRLFAYLERFWDVKFLNHCKCKVLVKNSSKIMETESSFGILLRTNPWVPAVETVYQSVNGQVKREVHIVMKQPAGLYINSDVIQHLLFDKVLYLNANSSGGSFCQFLGIRNSVETQIVKELLLKWSDRKDDDVPAVFCTALTHMKHVYQFLGSRLTRQDIQSLLQENPVYFVPDKTVVVSMNAREVVVSGKFLNKNEIWLTDRTGLFDKHRPILEDFHSEICNKTSVAEFYIDIPEIIELFKQEGKIDVQPKVEEYIKLLSLLCNTSSPKDASILQDVLYIFSTIGESLEPSQEAILSGQASRNACDVLKAFVKRKLKKQKVFPTTKQVWVSLDEQPLVPDNHEWQKLFSDNEGVHFLDMEDKSARAPRKGKGSVLPRGNRGKDPQSRVIPEMINIVIEACGVKKLSEVVDIRPTPEMISHCLQLQDYFSQTMPVLQKYLMARYDDLYQAFEQMEMKDMLANAKFYQAGKLEVSYWIPNMPTETFFIQQEKCVIHLPEVYFHMDHLATLSEVASREIAKFFSRGNTDCNNLLRSFLSDLFGIISGVSDEAVESLLQRHGVDDIEVPEEEQWEVEAPVLPEPDKPEEEEENVPVSEPVAEITSYKDGPFEIRAWPPVANPDNVHSRGTSEIPTSNVWPPPAAKDYMRTVKDLPANIRLVSDDDSKKIASQTQDIGYSGAKTDDVIGHAVIQRQNVETSEGGRNNARVSECESTKSSDPDHKNRDDRKTENRSNTAMTLSAEPTKQESTTDLKDYNMTGQQSVSGNVTPQNDEHLRGIGQTNPVDVQVNILPNRKDSHWHHGGPSEATEQNFRDKKSFIAGFPFWSDMATDYTYDELGTGKELGKMENIALMEETGHREIGQWGEALVAQYLQKQKELGNIKDYLWKNSDEETGCPFDFEIKLAGGEETQSNYIEVKSTASEHKEVFGISLQQVKFANQMKGNFHIYRVFNAGNPERVRMVRIKNLDMRFSTKQIKLCIVI